VVSDGSRDATVEIARQFLPHVIEHKVNLGKGATLKTGCEYAFEILGAQAVVFLDADDQHDPALLPTFFKRLNQGNPVVLGVRTFDKMPFLRTLGNRAASYLVQLFFGVAIPDIPSGYKALSKEAYNQVKWSTQEYAVEMEIATKVARYKLPFSIVKIPTIYHDTNRGMTMLDIFNMVTDIISWKLTL
jgi:glycosyltransferase involved in cell wall biosynthesis